MTKQDLLNLLNVDKIPQEAEINFDRLRKMYSEDDFQKVILNSPGIKPVDMIRQSFFETKLSQLRQREEIEELRKKVPAENETAKSLDLLGTALVEALKKTKGEEILADMKEQLSSFIQEKYGVTERKIVLVNPENGKKLDAITHQKLERVVKYISKGKNVLLVGPAGTGKNVLCQQVAELLDFEYYQANAVQQTYQLDGFIDANGVYQDTEFHKACKAASEGRDVLFVFDEIDGSNPEVMVRFNDALSSFKLEFPVETIDFKEHMHFMACANTWGTGASFEYVGRNQLDAATLNRWVNVEIDYDPRIEEQLCPDAELLTFCREFRKAINKNHLLHICSYRNIRDLADMIIGDDEMKTAETIKECLTKNMEPNDLSMIVRELSNGTYKRLVEELINA